MAAVFVNKFPGDGFLHNLLHLSMTWQMLDDSFINTMPQLTLAHVCEGARWIIMRIYKIEGKIVGGECRAQE